MLGHSELRVSEEKLNKYYKQERNAWSIKLESTLEVLANYFNNELDGHIFSEDE